MDLSLIDLEKAQFAESLIEQSLDLLAHNNTEVKFKARLISVKSLVHVIRKRLHFIDYLREQSLLLLVGEKDGLAVSLCLLDHLL